MTVGRAGMAVAVAAAGGLGAGAWISAFAGLTVVGGDGGAAVSGGVLPPP